ncbi:iron ABC transporter permease [Streptomyces sp. NPDC050264]|uniref:ABC transporter permease n=1 Tax=Streptomyces sp. NPDC050264 TaxID=3155038 RepID=UPI0034232EDF
MTGLPTLRLRRSDRGWPRPTTMSALVVGLLLAALLVYPLARLIYEVFGTDPAEPFRKAFALPDTGAMLLHTVLVVGVATVCSVLVAVLFAWLNERTDARLGAVTALLPLTPLLVPPLAGTIGWVFLGADRAGLLNVVLRDMLDVVGVHMDSGPFNIYSGYGLVFLYTLHIVPFVYLPVSAALSRLDPGLEEASRMCGVGPWRTLLKVTVPAVRPSIAAGALLGAVIGLATFSIPLIVGTGARIDVLAVRIYRLLTNGFPPRTQEAVALSLILLVAVVILSLLQRRVSVRGGHAMIGGKGLRAEPVSLGRARLPARLFMLAFVAASCVLPFLGLIYVSVLGRWEPRLRLDGLSLKAYRTTLLDNPRTQDALTNSFVLSLAGTAVVLIVAVVAVNYVARQGGWGARLLDVLAKAPGGLSHLVLAIAILTALAGPPLRLGGGNTILLLAFAVFFLPQAYVATGSALGQIAPELAEASAMSGAGPGRTFARITLPLARPGLSGAAVVLFVLMMSEVTGSALLSGTQSPVVGFVMIDLWANGSFATIAALGVVMTVVTSAVAGFLLLGGRKSVSLR